MFLSKGVADQPLQILAAYKMRNSSTSVCLEMIGYIPKSLSWISSERFDSLSYRWSLRLLWINLWRADEWDCLFSNINLVYFSRPNPPQKHTKPMFNCLAFGIILHSNWIRGCQGSWEVLGCSITQQPPQATTTIMSNTDLGCPSMIPDH